MSIKKTLFLALQEELRNKVEGLVWIDKNMGQLNALDQFHVFPMPAVLIEFGRTEWQGLGDGTQQGICLVRLLIIYENYSDSNSETDSLEIQRALQFFDFVESVNSVVQGYQGDGWSPFVRVGEDEDNDHQNFVTTIVEYQTLLQDNSGQKSYKEIPVEVEPKPVFKRPLDRPESNIVSDFVV